MHPLIDQVRATLEGAGRPPAGAPLVVAVSGGLDSMVLLHALHHLAPRHGWSLAVAHFNHLWRGADSDADEAFVATAAERLRLRWVSGRSAASAPSGAPGHRGSREDEARRDRHTFLAQVAREVGAHDVALGHHADDQSELFLLRLLRGAGGPGFRGMRVVDPSPAAPELHLLRPLLHLRRQDLEAAATAWGLTWREDVTNTDPTFLRNRVRQELLPLLRKNYQPGIDALLGREQELISALHDEVSALAGEWLKSTAPGRPFGELGRGMQREILRQQLERAGVFTGFDRIEWLRTHPEAMLVLDPDTRVRLTGSGRIEWLPPASPAVRFSEECVHLDLSAPNGTATLSGAEIAWTTTEMPGGGLPDHRVREPGREVMDADQVGGAVTVRHWRPGDRFQPIGAARPAKLQDLFTNGKVPEVERHQRVVAATAGGEIFWVEGLRLGHLVRVREDTRRRLEWRWKRHSPGGS